MTVKKPTEEAYAELQTAYDFFNRALFDNELPACMITFQREKRTMGYFSANRFVRTDGTRCDEIALNPEYFAVYGLLDILQTIVHEMAHQWQFHFGKPSRACYHNQEWALKMEGLGLMPSSTGRPGGKKTGQKMGDYTIHGGRFEHTSGQLLSEGFSISWMDRFLASKPESIAPLWSTTGQPGDAAAADMEDPDGDVRISEISPAISAILLAAAKPAQGMVQNLCLEQRGPGNHSNRTKYTCPECKINVWGKPKLRIKCEACNLLLEDTCQEIQGLDA